MEPSLETLQLNPPVAAEASIIWLHGLGADCHDFEPLVPGLRRAISRPTRFVFPNAPTRPVTINGGLPMRAWFDVTGMEFDRGQDAGGIRESARALEQLVRREMDRGLGADRIVLAGFSQGGAIALHAGLRFPERLAGVIVLSAYLPLAESLDAEASEAARRTPIFMAHGAVDPIVPHALGEASKSFLAERGYDVEWHEYAMPHAVCPEEESDLGGWLERVLA